jgi:hypothetical protein
MARSLLGTHNTWFFHLYDYFIFYRISVCRLLNSLDMYPGSMYLRNPVVTSLSLHRCQYQRCCPVVMYVLRNPNLAAHAFGVMAASGVCGSSEEEVEVVF